MIDESTAEIYLGQVDAAEPAEQQRMLGELREWRQHQLGQEQEQRATYTRELYKDPETLGGHWLPEMQRALQPFMNDPKQDRAGWANTRFLSQEFGVTVEQAAGAYDSLLQRYSFEHFGGEPKDNLSFYGAVSARYQKADDLAAARMEATKHALARGVQDQRSGKSPMWATHEGALRGLDGDKARAAYEEDAEAAGLLYGQTYMQAYTLMHENPELGGIVNSIARHMGRNDLAQPGAYAEGEDAIRKSAVTLAKMDPEKRQAFLSMLPAWLETEGEKDPKGALAKVAEMFRQAGDAMGRGVGASFGKGRSDALGDQLNEKIIKSIQNGTVRIYGDKAELGNVVTGDTIAAQAGVGDPFAAIVIGASYSDAREATPEEREALLQEALERREVYALSREVDHLAKEGFKPIRSVTPLGVIEDAGYAIAGSTAVMAPAFVPVVGWTLSAKAYYAPEYNRLRREHPEMSAEEADKVAGVSATAMAAVEVLSAGAIKGGGSLLARVPGLERVIKQAGAPNSRLWRPLLGRVAAGTGEQVVQEGVQEAIPGMVLNALTEDYPDVDWAAAFGATVSDPVTLIAVLPFVLVGAGVGTWRESRAVTRALPNPDALQSLGLSKEVADAIAGKAQAGDMDGAQTEFQAAWAERKPEDIQRGAEQLKAEKARVDAMQDSPEMPTLRANGGQWEIVEPDGVVSATFESEEAAMQQYTDRMAWEQGGHGQAVRDLLQWFQSRTDPDRKVEITGKTKTVEEGAAESELNAETLAERVRIAGISEGADPSTLIIKGETVQELREGVYHDAIRLFNGADVMDVVEEHAHAQENKDTREGRLTREDKAAAAQMWAEATGFRLEDPANPTDAEISEALADMVKADFTNRRKELSGLPASVRAFIARLRVYFREVLGRAKTLRELRDAGKLSGSIEGYLARSLGIDEQVDVNRATAEAVGVATTFSIGSLDGSQKMPWQEPAKAQKWALENLRGEYPNEATDSDFVVNAGTIKHTFNHSKMNGDKVRVLEAIEGIIRDALPLQPEKPYTRGKRKGVEADQLFYAPVVVDGKMRIARLVVHRMDALSLGERQVYDVRSVEIEEAQLLRGPFPEDQATNPDMLRFQTNIEDLTEAVNRAFPTDFEGETRHSIGRASYLADMSATMDATMTSGNRLEFAEKVQANLARARRFDDRLEREVKLEMETEARQIQQEEDVANLRVEEERQLSALADEQKTEIARAGEANNTKFMDRIEAAKTERERKLLEREARETARDLKRGIEKKFKEQERALKERTRSEEKRLREKALGIERAEKVRADEADKRAAMLQALADYNAVLMALPAEVRGKLGGFVQLASVRTDKAREKFFRERFPKVAAAYEKYLRTEYDAVLKRVFARAKPKRDKAGKKPVGKLGAEMHNLFSTLEDAVFWTPEKANAHIATLEAEIAGGELSAEAEAHKQLEIGLVGLVADWANADSARRGAAVKMLKEVLQKGYGDFLVKKLEERAARGAMRDQLKTDTGKSGTAAERDARHDRDNGLFGKLRSIKFELSSFEQLLKYAFGESSKIAQGIADRQREADNRRVDEEHMVSDGINALFTDLAGGSYAGAQLHWRLSQKSLKVRGRHLSELEAITATLMWRQADGRRHMMGRRDEEGNVTGSWSYDQAFADELEKRLSSEALAVRDYLASEYAQEWAQVNPLFRKLNGVDLPRQENYSPLTVKPQQTQAGEVVDPVTGVAVSPASTTPGSFRTRGVAVAEPEFRDAVKVFMAHKSQMNHWQAYAELALEMRSVLGNREVMNSVEAKAGESASKALAGWLDYMIQGGNRDAAARLEVNGMLSRMLSRAASMAIVGRVGVLAVQSTQLGAALAEMPTASYLKRMGQLFTGQLGWGDALDSAYIQRRLIEMPPVVRQALEGLRAEKPSRIKHAAAALGRTIAGADALFTAGTYAMVFDYRLSKLKEQGASDIDARAQATMEAERITDRLAQPVRPGARSIFELRTSTNPMTRLIWAFASEGRKNLGLALYAMSERTFAEKARTMAYVAMISPLLASLIRNAWRDARDSEDDDIFDERNWDAKRLALAVLTEPLAGVPVLGEMAQEAIYKGAGVYSPSGNLLSSGANALPALKRLPGTLTGEEDARQVLRDAESLLTGAGLFNANLAAAASLSHIVRDLFGVGENVKEATD